jgi:glycosyltransferase involved in cell wall biosynthesis
MRTAAFSIVSPNYLHYARVLMGSLQRSHPGWDRFVLVVGASSAPRDDEPTFALVPLEALPLPSPRQFCFRYTILELNTAVKPWMFEHLFTAGYDRVVYLDPDVFVYTPLVELDAAPDALLTLTPHLTGSIEGDDHPSERTVLQSGAYNLGFLAASRRAPLAGFLEWWREKLERQCVVDLERGLFVDQKWLDLAPGMFPDVKVLRHDGYNVAYWNLRQRRLRAEGGGITVNGQPLRFFHFSGLDAAQPELVSRHDGRLMRADLPEVGALIDAYWMALRAAGYESCRKAGYAYGRFNDGTPVPDIARIAYRESDALQAAAGDDPFACPELFLGFRDPPRRPPLAARAGVRSYRTLSRARPLVRLFPPAMRASMRQFLLGRTEPALTPARRVLTSLEPGLNVVGYLGRDTGVGASARLCEEACRAAGIASHLIDIDRHGGVAGEAVYRASLYHVNADQLLVVHEQRRDVFAASAYNIGCWHWELQELPELWTSAAGPLHEIWAPSAFVQSALGRKLTIPVVHMPHGIEIGPLEACSPEQLGVSAGRFTFLVMFDFDSVLERKNPLAAVEAFRRAFPATAPVALLIKTSHGAEHPHEYAALEGRVRGVPNVHLIDRSLSRAQVGGLLAACDAVVSLHRSEGFGLVPAEAMCHGKPVIATGWSGNMDFMDTGNSCPVAYGLVTLGRDHQVYASGQQWADPDVEHAAHLMRRVVDDDAYRRQVGERARETMRTRFSPEAAGLRYRRRLALLGLMEPPARVLAR